MNPTGLSQVPGELVNGSIDPCHSCAQLTSNMRTCGRSLQQIRAGLL